MSDLRLLISIEVVDFLRKFPRREQERLLGRFREIAAFPSSYCDYLEQDAVGRRLGVHVVGRFGIKFWDDSADRHLKILDVHLAD